MPRIADSDYTEVHLGDSPEAPTGEQSEANPEASPVELDPDRPFRILVVGDFSGRAWRKHQAHTFVPQLIDRDNFDEVLEGMQVGLNLHGIALSFRELEDFHPDHIYEAAPIFQDLDRHLEQAAAAPQAAASRVAPPPAPSSGSLLDQIMAEHSTEPEAEPVSGGEVSVEDANDLSSFIRRVSKGHVEPRPGPAQKQHAAKRQALANEVMNGILHDPHMQALESAWRSLYMLVRGLDTDSDLKIYVLNITLPELISEMEKIGKDLRRKGPWALIAGNYAFGQSELDAQVLERLAGLASSLGAPFVAEAQPPAKGSASQAWKELRNSPEARWIGLALPRFLLRLPYGQATASVESFPFEEMPQSAHADYLWGNPAFFCAHLIGKSFLARGWTLNPIDRRIDDLPMHVYREEGEPVAKPCAEVLMTEHDATDLLEAGFMPLASLKYEPAALIVRFQSIAKPLAPLAGLT